MKIGTKVRTPDGLEGHVTEVHRSEARVALLAGPTRWYYVMSLVVVPDGDPFEALDNLP